MLICARIGLLAAADVYDEANAPPGSGLPSSNLNLAALPSEQLAADFGREFLEAFRSTEVFRHWSALPRPKFREQAAKYSYSTDEDKYVLLRAPTCTVHYIPALLYSYTYMCR